MKNIALAVALLLLIFAVPAATQTPSPTSGTAQLSAAQRAAIEKELTEATKLLVEDMNRLSTENTAKFLSSEFQERIGGGNISPTAPGKDAFIKWAANLQSQRSSHKLETDLIKVYVISADVAYIIWAGGGAVVQKSGRHGGVGDAQTFIWRKEQTGWKIIHVHESWW